MKTFRFFGTALLAVFMGFNLTSCGDDDDDADESGSLPVPPEASAKKLMSVDSYTDGERDGKYTFTYDDKGRLVKTVETKIYSSYESDDTYTFTWKDNQVICNDGYDVYTFYMEKGKVVSCKGEDLEMYNDVYRYDQHGQLVALGNAETTEEGRFWSDLEWKNGKVVALVQEPVEDMDGYKIVLEYGKDSKGYCPYFYKLMSMNSEIHVPQPGIFGKVMTSLPVKMSAYYDDNSMEEVQLTHTVDNDGYVTSTKVVFVVKDANGNVVEDAYADEVYKYTWK